MPKTYEINISDPLTIAPIQAFPTSPDNDSTTCNDIMKQTVLQIRHDTSYIRQIVEHAFITKVDIDDIDTLDSEFILGESSFVKKSGDQDWLNFSTQLTLNLDGDNHNVKLNGHMCRQNDKIACYLDNVVYEAGNKDYDLKKDLLELENDCVDAEHIEDRQKIYRVNEYLQYVANNFSWDPLDCNILSYEESCQASKTLPQSNMANKALFWKTMKWGGSACVGVLVCAAFVTVMSVTASFAWVFIPVGVVLGLLSTGLTFGIMKVSGIDARIYMAENSTWFSGIQGGLGGLSSFEVAKTAREGLHGCSIVPQNLTVNQPEKEDSVDSSIIDNKVPTKRGSLPNE